MEMTVPHGMSIPVHDQSQIGEARREAALLAAGLGLDEEAVGRASLVATEAGCNVYLHGGGGELVLNAVEWRQQPCLELLAVDRGRGMADIEKCMRDGYSTAGTPGTGLGAIVRVSDAFDLYSVAGGGTVLMARLLSKRGSTQPSVESFEYSAASVAYPGEAACGDAWATTRFNGGRTFFVADGLGHGHFAAEAAQEAVRVFENCNGAKPVEVIDRVHGALRSTRGAAVAVARIDLEQQKMSFAGIGNISASINANGGSRSMVSLNGTVGHEMRKVQEFVYPWSGDALLVMHSDGLGTRWNLNDYPGLPQRLPGVIAGVLYRDFCRGRDDVTVLVARCAQK